MKYTNRSITSFRLRSVICILFISLFFLLVGVISGDEGYMLIWISSIPVIMVMLYQFKISENDIFTPLNFFWANLFFGVLLQAIYFVLIDDGRNRYGLYHMGSMRSMYMGIFAILLGVFFFLIGYSIYSIRKKNTPSKGYHWDRSRIIIIVHVILGISIVSILTYISIYGILDDIKLISTKLRIYDDDGNSYANGYIILGASLSQVGFLLLYVYRSIKLKRKARLGVWLNIVLISLFIIGLIQPLLSSQRTSIIYFLISISAVNNFCYRRWSFNRLVSIFLVIIVVVIGMGAFRFASGRGDTAFGYYLENAGLTHIVSTIAGSGNLFGLGKTGILINSVPEKIDFQNGSTYGLWAIAPIPKDIWPDKPIVRIGGVVGSVVYGTSERSGVPPGYIGEAYLNFGWWGIPFISFVFGIGARYFYEEVGRMAYHNPENALVYSSLYSVLYFTGFSSDFTGLITAFLKIYIPLIFLLYYVKKSYK